MVDAMTDTMSDTFRDADISWLPLGDFPGFTVSVCRVDLARGTADFLVRFEPQSRIQLHRHLCDTTTFVVSGEHRMYNADGTVHEIRPTGSYTFSPPGEPHREGAGAAPCVVLYHLQADDDGAFEFLDDDLGLLASLGLAGIHEFWQHGQSS